jgi:hypothetical protein
LLKSGEVSLSWKEQGLLDARRALSDARKVLTDVAALYAAQISAVAAVSDLQSRNFLANTYQIRIYNDLLQNQVALDAVSKDLLPSELYMLGGLYTLNGLSDGLRYYKLALDKTKSDDEKATIYRELGAALFPAGLNHDLKNARDAYVQALTISAKQSYLWAKYSFFLAELGVAEEMYGDWKCGVDISNYALPLLDARAAAPTQTKRSIPICPAGDRIGGL